MKLSDFQGKAVLLNFWATWCEPCKVEMPWFVDLQKKYGPQGLQVIGVAMDDASPSVIAVFCAEDGSELSHLGRQRRGWRSNMEGSNICRRLFTSAAMGK